MSQLVRVRHKSDGKMYSMKIIDLRKVQSSLQDMAPSGQRIASKKVSVAEERVMQAMSLQGANHPFVVQTENRKQKTESIKHQATDIDMWQEGRNDNSVECAIA